MAFIRKGYETGTPFDIYGFYLFDQPPTLSEVVKVLEWGSNRNIKAGEIRIDRPAIPEHQRRVKAWPKVTSPGQIIKSGTFLAKGKGTGVGATARIIVRERGE
jgi:hypothetical protein